MTTSRDGRGDFGEKKREQEGDISRMKRATLWGGGRGICEYKNEYN